MGARVTSLASLAWIGALVPLAVAGRVSAAEPTTCQPVDVTWTPTDRVQVVVWIQDSTGAVVDTAYVTRSIGSLGLGNRPGRFDLNTGFRWEEGRRTTTFPVWAHRRGHLYPMVVHQDDDDSQLEQ